MPHHLRTLPDASVVACRSGNPERAHFVKRAILALRRRRRRRKAIADLESLTDHLLDDIGLSTNDIPRAVDGLLATAGAAPQPVAMAQEPREPLRRAA